MKAKNLTAALICILAVFNISASDSCIDRWEEFSHSAEKAQLAEWMRDTARNILSKDKTPPDLNISLPAQPDCTGLFITLIKNRKVRGCFGAFNHNKSSFYAILRDYIKGALSYDPRYEPLEKHEFKDTEIILTIASNIEPVNDINSVDISNYGLFIECEDLSKLVIVPAEYRTISRVMKLTGNSQCRFYKFKGVTIK
ncbi:MAG: AMMECR1 domain-containing protein [Spirochaetes bacterium]|nr:AMMECR1 domain-containing protein [Spirochaetota bacterium]